MADLVHNGQVITVPDVFCQICKMLLTLAEATNFCEFHRSGWLQSPERTSVDWTSNESYESQSQNYTERFNSPPPVEENADL